MKVDVAHGLPSVFATVDNETVTIFFETFILGHGRCLNHEPAHELFIASAKVIQAGKMFLGKLWDVYARQILTYSPF